MGMAEIRDAFEAYATGELAEYELRNALRSEIQTTPGAVPRYAAMAAALRRRQLISAELEAAVIADMNAIVGNTSPPQAASEVRDATTKASPRNSTGPQASALPQRTGTIFALPPAGVSEPSSPAVPTGNRSTGPQNKGLAWDAQEKLAEPEAPIGVGMTLRERFELVEVLGRGGMGVVYKAVDQREVENKGREPHVAIKVLNEEFKRHPESARALQRESKKAMRLAHPNIVLVRDFDRDRGNVFMVMELLHGTPLDQLVLRQHPKGLPLERVIDIVTGLGAALSYAHQQGIVHADFKPSNAFLTEQGLVKVLDFGVARVALALDRNESTVFDAGKLNAVSPAYASIELLVGEAPDPRDDIYALACVTYFLLTARHPFNGIDAIKARDSELQPQPIPGLGDPQWRALRAALVFDRWDRTPSVREFLTQFCTIARRRTPGVTAQASKIASEARTGLKSGFTRLLDAAIRRPWLPAVPAALLLVLGAAILVFHRVPRPAASAAPLVTSPIATTSTSAAPPALNDTAGAQALQQRVAAINPDAPDVIDTAVASASDIRSLASLSPGDPAVQRLRAALQTALAAQVEGMLTRNDLNGARRLVTRVGVVLPATTLRAYSSDALVRRQQLIRLMNMPEPTQHWADQLSTAIADLSELAPADDPLIREARTRSDAAFLTAAQQARTQSGMDEARESLAVGMTANPQSPSLTRAAVALANDKPMPAPPTVTSHESVAAVPVAVVPAAPAATVVPRPVQTILSQAKQQMAAADTEGALATLAAGRRKFGSSPALKDLEITYDRVEEEFERIDMTAALNVKAHEEWLSEIRSLAGDDYPQIEQMLARTLSHDIAEQRTRADRSTVVEALQSAGRKLFPDYASLLEDPHVAAAEGAGSVTDAPSAK